MNPITWLQTFLDETQTSTPGINSNRMIIDATSLTKYLSKHKKAENFLLIGVVPDISSKGNTADDYKQVTTTQLMILEKTAYSEVDYDEFYDIFKRAYDLATIVVKKMLADSSSGCNAMRFLNVSSIQIIPIWNLHACNGCNILFNFDSDL